MTGLPVVCVLQGHHTDAHFPQRVRARYHSVTQVDLVRLGVPVGLGIGNRCSGTGNLDSSQLNVGFIRKLPPFLQRVPFQDISGLRLPFPGSISHLVGYFPVPDNNIGGTLLCHLQVETLGFSDDYGMAFGVQSDP